MLFLFSRFSCPALLLVLMLFTINFDKETELHYQYTGYILIMSDVMSKHIGIIITKS